MQLHLIFKGAYLYLVYSDMRFATKAYITLSPLNGPLPINLKLDVDVMSFGMGVVNISYNYHLL